MNERLRKGGLVKPKYWVDTKKRKRFKRPMFSVATVVTVNDAEVDKFLKRNRRLPDHVHRTEVKDETE